MEKLLLFPEQQRVEDEAIEWLIRLDGDTPLNPNEEQQLEAWLARSPVHREALKSANRFWARSNILGELAQPRSIMDLCRQHIVNWLWPEPAVAAPALGMALMVGLGLTFHAILNATLWNIERSNGIYVTAASNRPSNWQINH